MALRARWVMLRARWVTAKSSLGDAKSSLRDVKSLLGDANLPPRAADQSPPHAAPAHAYLGLGFAERHQAVDFNEALQDYTRCVRPEHAHGHGPAGWVMSRLTELTQ